MIHTPILNGCTDYLKGYLKGKEDILFALPKSHPYCLYCRALISDTYLDKHTCMLTMRYVFNPKKSMDTGCPIEWESE